MRYITIFFILAAYLSSGICPLYSWDSRKKNRDLVHMEILSDDIELLPKETFSQKFLFVERNEMEIVFDNVAIALSTITEKEYLQLPVFKQHGQ